MLQIAFNPDLPDDCRTVFLQRCRALHTALEGAQGEQDELWEAVKHFRIANRSLGEQPSVEQLKLLTALNVVADLVAQGWSVRASHTSVELDFKVLPNLRTIFCPE